MSDPAVLNLADCAPQPWKNGAGATRELAVHPPGAGMQGFDWRISVAEVANDAPFSAFEGIDRCIVLLRGAGMRLESAEGLSHVLDQPLQPFRFDGGLSLSARLIGGPSQDFNVMTRRGRYRAEVQVIAVGAPQALAGCDAALLLCVAGSVEAVSPVGTPCRVSAGQAGLWREGFEVVTVQASEVPSRLLAVRLHRHAAGSTE